MHRLILATAIAIGVVGCSPGGTPSDSSTAAPAAQGSLGEAGPVVPEHNIGDVESAITVTTRLDPSTDLSQLRYNELETKKGDLAMAQLEVREPYPDALWVNSRVESHSRGLQVGDSALIRQYVYIGTEREPVAEQVFTWYREHRTLLEPQTLRVNVMEHLDPIPDSVLVHSRVDIYWLPGTKAEDVDPEALNRGPDAQKISNSFRITF